MNGKYVRLLRLHLWLAWWSSISFVQSRKRNQNKNEETPQSIIALGGCTRLSAVPDHLSLPETEGQRFPAMSWALCVTYWQGSAAKAMYPDFDDNLLKAQGVAEYARQNQSVGRIQLIRKGKTLPAKSASNAWTSQRAPSATGAEASGIIDYWLDDLLLCIFQWIQENRGSTSGISYQKRMKRRVFGRGWTEKAYGCQNLFKVSIKIIPPDGFL